MWALKGRWFLIGIATLIFARALCIYVVLLVFVTGGVRYEVC